MLDRIEFVFGEALQGLRRHGLMTFAAISTVAVALYLLGGLGMVYLRVQSFASSLSSQYEIQAYFKDGTTLDQIKAAAQATRKISGVGAVVHIPKERAWEKTKRQNPELTAGLDNPYPDALKVTVADLKQTTAIVEALKAESSIQPDGVMYHDPTQRFLNDLMRLIRWLGIGLGGLLFITAGILIYNAIRLTIDARRREIRIMQLVGASHLTVRAPFLIEGAIEGALGGLAATGLLWLSFQSVSNYVERNLVSMSRPDTFAIAPIALTLLVVGAGYGMVCSWFAVRKPSKLRGGAI